MAQKLYHGGVDASGVVHAIRPGQPDMTGNVWTEFDVSIKKPDGELYQTTIKQSMLPAQLEEIREGAAITVKYDPDAPEMDESYNSIVWEARYYEPLGKFMRVLSFGMFSDFFENIWRMTAHFDAESHTRTRVTITGNAHPDTRAAFRELAAEHGGTTGLAVGV